MSIAKNVSLNLSLFNDFFLKVRIIFYFESPILVFFATFRLGQSTKYNIFLWLRWFLSKNFVSLPWKLDTPNYNNSHTEQCNQFNRSISGLVCLTVRNFSLYFQFWTNYKVKHIYRSTDLAIGKIGDAKKYRWREIWPTAKNLDLKHRTCIRNA